MRKHELAASDRDLEQLTSLFRLLSDKTRLNILLLLASGERNVSALCRELRLPQPTVSHHLGLLRMNSMIGHRRLGKHVFYGLSGQIGAEGEGLIVIGTRFDIRVAVKSGN